MERHLLSSAQDAKTFVTAGNALVTFQSKVTHDHLTYKVCASKDGNVFFVKYLNGNNNDRDYAYLGMIDRSGTFRLTKKSRAGADSKVFKAFNYVWNALRKSQLPAQVEIWHEGRCGKCGRTLTVPSSIARGIGPVCAGELL